LVRGDEQNDDVVSPAGALALLRILGTCIRKPVQTQDLHSAQPASLPSGQKELLNRRLIVHSSEVFNAVYLEHEVFHASFCAVNA
jgi:hypothetical protein